MKAIQVQEFGGPEVLKIVETQIPKPQPDEVLVNIKAVGINPVETYRRSGVYNPQPKLPYIPGTDGAGIVEQVGSEIKNFKVGDHVLLAGAVSGTYAQFATAKESQVWPLSKNLSFSEGAAVYIPYGTAFHALIQRSKYKPKETVLVHGASGGVGIAAVQLAKAYGLTVIGTAGSEEGMKLVKEQGADHVLNHKDEDYGKEIEKLTDGKGVDIILEMLANVNLEKDLTFLARGGRVLVIGSRGPIQITPRLLMSKRSEVHGVALQLLTPEETKQLQEDLLKAFDKGALKPVVGKVFPLADAPRSHKEIIEPPSGAFGKLVLDPWA